ncbi:unnamed protein product [Allacma fusca]|uniref:Uncharacterized protein n=1 Tax=Allacma fusca TaxID=39272 RepID=A0A8J2PPZ9_9HEXA|nr:unnamed protein product [Allacma fusca]
MNDERPAAVLTMNVAPDIQSDSDNPFRNIDLFRRDSNSSSTPAYNTASSRTTSPHRTPPATMDPTRLLFDKPKFPSQETSSDNIPTEPLHSAPPDVNEHFPASTRHPVQSLHKSTSTQTIASPFAVPESRQSELPKPNNTTITSRHATLDQTVHFSDTILI